MGWQTDLFCNITFNKETYNSIDEVDIKIEDLNKMITYLQTKLRNLAIMTEPNKMLPEEEREDPMFYISRDVSEALEELQDCYIERYKLQLLKAHWSSCHNDKGLAINPPENISWDTAYLDGDFIKSEKYPNAHE